MKEADQVPGQAERSLIAVLREEGDRRLDRFKGVRWHHGGQRVDVEPGHRGTPLQLVEILGVGVFGELVGRQAGRLEIPPLDLRGGEVEEQRESVRVPVREECGCSLEQVLCDRRASPRT